MRKQRKINQLQRTASHRKAMLSNMVVSLFYHERIESTLAKAKVARQVAEKLITRAKKNSDPEISESQKLHNIREASKIIRDKEVLYKLFHDIGARYTNRNGGYTRILKIGARSSDASEMALIELVEKKELAELKDERKKFRESLNKRTNSKSTENKKETKEKKKDK